MSTVKANRWYHKDGSAGLVINQNGDVTNTDNTKSHMLKLDVSSSNRYATWSTSFSGETTGTIDAVNTLGYPSGVKAIIAQSWWQIDGYSGSGGSDHAVCAFGPSTPSTALFASTGNISDSATGSFVFAHDGDGVSGWGTYGTWWNGIVTVNNNGLIYYRLGNGYSGGTHYLRLNFYGYFL